MLHREENGRNDEKRLPGDLLPTIWLIISICISIILIAVILATKLFPLLFVLVSFIFNTIRLLIDSSRLNLKYFKELPIEDDLFKAIDWSTFSNNLRIYIAISDTSLSKFVYTNGSAVFLSKNIFVYFSAEEIALMAKMADEKQRRFEQLLNLVNGMVYICFFASLFMLFKGVPLAALPLALMGFLLWPLRHFIANSQDKSLFESIFTSQKQIEIGFRILNSYKRYLQQAEKPVKLGVISSAKPTQMQKWLTEAKTKALSTQPPDSSK